MNIVAVKTITDVTPSVAIDYLLRFGFTSLQLEGANSDYGQALALGGLTNGVSNLELTAAYAWELPMAEPTTVRRCTVKS